LTLKENKKRIRKIVYGWNVFNQDTLYKAHDKRLRKLKFSGIVKIKDQLVDREKLNISHQPTEKAKQDMINELKEKYLSLIYNLSYKYQTT